MRGSACASPPFQPNPPPSPGPSFSVLFLGRLLVYRDTVRPFIRHNTEPLFLGAIPMAFSIISNGVVLFVGPR